MQTASIHAGCSSDDSCSSCERSEALELELLNVKEELYYTEKMINLIASANQMLCKLLTASNCDRQLFYQAIFPIYDPNGDIIYDTAKQIIGSVPQEADANTGFELLERLETLVYGDIVQTCKGEQECAKTAAQGRQTALEAKYRQYRCVLYRKALANMFDAHASLPQVFQNRNRTTG